MRAVHRDVSATIPGVMDNAKQMGAQVHVYDSDQGLDEATGVRTSPRLVAHALPDGKIAFRRATRTRSRTAPTTPNRPTGRTRSLAKAHEQLPNVRDVAGPRRGVWRTGGQTTKTNPDIEKRVGQNVAKEFRRCATTSR